jgi:hypothetical protein
MTGIQDRACPVAHLQSRPMAVSTARRWCPKCEKEYVATVYSEPQGKATSLAAGSTCPDCGTHGQVPDRPAGQRAQSAGQLPPESGSTLT